uniref:T9SS type A sorting domain-containing protein n=2 Tax=candidate division WOR-3 bacterium TaxID=2052148 RepID=A0A7V4E5H1_UNCW3
MRKILKVAVCIVLPVVLFARTVTINTGQFQIQLNDYGRIRVFTTDGTRNMDRISLLVGLNSSAVFDYYSDAGTRRATDSTGNTLPQSLEMFGVFDNSYSNLPPAVSESLHIYTWNGKNFAICDFHITNETGQTSDFYVSLELISQIGGTYENDTSEVLSDRLAVMYDGSANSAVGVVMLHPQSMFSYRALPWGEHQYDDGFYWLLMTSTDIDTLVLGDANGVYGVLNAGLYRGIESDSKMRFVVGILFGQSKEEIQTVAQECIDYYEQYMGVREGAFRDKWTTILAAASSFKIYTDFTGLAEWKLIDVGGNVVKTGKINSSGWHEISTRGLGQGIYFLNISADGKEFIRRVVVVK